MIIEGTYCCSLYIFYINNIDNRVFRIICIHKHITRPYIPEGLVLMPTTVETFEAQTLAKCVLLLDKQFCLDMQVVCRYCMLCT